MNNYPIPVLGFAAYSGTGKTTLLEALIPLLTQQGLRLGVLKHAHHEFDVDKPGKDSYRLRKAGATQMLVASHQRHVMMTETPEREADFDDLLSRFDHHQLDLILVEGCKNIAFDKIELHRDAVGKPWLHPYDDNIIAIACDQKPISTTLPILDINDLPSIAQYVLRYVNQLNSTRNAQEQAIQGLSVIQGVNTILERITTMKATEVSQLHEIDNRIISRNISSPIASPHYTQAAIDGYAISYQSAENSQFRVFEHLFAGNKMERTLQLGEAVKIMTGAPMPDGADCVIALEDVQSTSDGVTINLDAVTPGQNIRYRGEELQCGQLVYESGQRLTSTHIGLLASLGITECEVYRSLRVGVFSTGDEVQSPGLPLRSAAIYDANRYVLLDNLQRLGCLVDDLGVLPDDPTEIGEALTSAAVQCDVLLGSGGVSFGEADYVKSALEQLEVGHIDFWRINMHPGRPMAFGHIGARPFFGLPGNPVAATVGFLQFVEPAIRKMQGEVDWIPLKTRAFTLQRLKSKLGVTEFVGAVYRLTNNGELEVEQVLSQDTRALYALSQANCLIEIPEHIEQINRGEHVTIIPLQGRI
ncbi:bifunctional molybdopterin-guanine dinucleotide biosynthesis adaptor protein MobB/molybdopterin molybdotransferase MoeA [Vibrio sp. AK197]